jgi:SAM-dependent methyltransferase
MQSITNWSALWRELVELSSTYHLRESDPWGYNQSKALEFAERLANRWQTPDSSREFILGQVTPESTVLDIGSGIGAWSALIARKAGSVTAVEPSPAMVEQMRNLLVREGVQNVTVVQEPWPGARVGMHDFSLCSHAMYGTLDLPAFIRRMVEVTRKTCFLLIRALDIKGVMAKAAQRVLGQPYDSPNFTVAYNVLIEMGIYANVLMEKTGKRKSWAHESLEGALEEVKLRLGISDSTTHDAFLIDLLQRRLTYRDGMYIWPPGAQSALIYWEVD